MRFRRGQSHLDGVSGGYVQKESGRGQKGGEVVSGSRAVTWNERTVAALLPVLSESTEFHTTVFLRTRWLRSSCAGSLIPCYTNCTVQLYKLYSTVVDLRLSHSLSTPLSPFYGLHVNPSRLSGLPPFPRVTLLYDPHLPSQPTDLSQCSHAGWHDHHCSPRTSY